VNSTLRVTPILARDVTPSYAVTMKPRSIDVTSESRANFGGLANHEFLARVQDDREFDLAMLRSTIEYFNLSGFTIEPFQPVVVEQGAQVQVVRRRSDANVARRVSEESLAAFTWVTPVLHERARLLDFDNTRITWRPGDDKLDWDPWHAGRFFGWVLCGPTVRDIRPRRLTNSEMRQFALRGIAQIEKDASEAIRPLVIEQRLAFKSGSVERRSLPWIQGVERCVAYAIALVLEDRHGVGGRIRQCPYVEHGAYRSHWFLDFAVSATADGLRRGRQNYCSPSHASRDRQRRYRQRRAKGARSRARLRRQRHDS
jgi:hypothetical protein